MISLMYKIATEKIDTYCSCCARCSGSRSMVSSHGGTSSYSFLPGSSRVLRAFQHRVMTSSSRPARRRGFCTRAWFCTPDHRAQSLAPECSRAQHLKRTVQRHPTSTNAQTIPLALLRSCVDRPDFCAVGQGASGVARDSWERDGSVTAVSRRYRA